MQLFKLWCAAIERKDITIEKRQNFRICDKHFGNDDKFYNNKNRTNLKSFIRSILQYGSPIWTSTSASNKNKLSIIQNKILRYLSKDHYLSSHAIIQNLLSVDPLQKLPENKNEVLEVTSLQLHHSSKKPLLAASTSTNNNLPLLKSIDVILVLCSTILISTLFCDYYCSFFYCHEVQSEVNVLRFFFLSADYDRLDCQSLLFLLVTRIFSIIFAWTVPALSRSFFCL